MIVPASGGASLIGALLLLAGIAGCSGEHGPAASPAPSDPQRLGTRARQSLERGIDWLWRQQAADGGWHSTRYGQMRGGVGNTALVLDGLSWAPQSREPNQRQAIERGIRFLVTNLDQAGFVRSPEGSVDYPTYATALLLSAMQRLAIDAWPDEQHCMQAYLQAAQQTHRQGWSADDADFGGWHHTGGTEIDVKVSGETNLSVTRIVLEALQTKGALDEGARVAALAYLTRCQNLDAKQRGDGGFYFTATQDDPRNKAGLTDVAAGASPRARSYGSATADGVCSLLACEVPNSDPPVQAALTWLEQHDTIDFVPGFPDDEETVLAREGLKFYYYASLARCLKQLPSSDLAKRRTALLETLIAQQRPDGSWENTSSLMREDDPLVATAWAVAALGILGE